MNLDRKVDLLVKYPFCLAKESFKTCGLGGIFPMVLGLIVSPLMYAISYPVAVFSKNEANRIRQEIKDEIKEECDYENNKHRTTSFQKMKLVLTYPFKLAQHDWNKNKGANVSTFGRIKRTAKDTTSMLVVLPLEYCMNFKRNGFLDCVFWDRETIKKHIKDICNYQGK